jgi:hypothetical protein
MIAFKSCPRCQGDLHISRDADEMTCLQCGYELRPEEKTRLRVRLNELRQRQLARAA